MNAEPSVGTEGASGRGRGGALLPRYALYGDSSGSTVDFIHVERLRDRSEVFDWSIDAHTHAGIHQVVLLLSGDVHAELDVDSHVLIAPAVIAIPAGVVHAFEFEPGSSGFILAVPEGQLEGSPIELWLRSRLFAAVVTLSLRDDDTLVDRLESLATEILREEETVDIGRVATIEWLTWTVLVLLARESDRFHETGSGVVGSDLFGEFQSQLEDHFAEHWRVGRYAKALHISESSLNRVCRAVAGATAFQLITRRLEIEARRRLTYSTVPIHRIARDLGFADPSYFARFFRSQSGVSPREFRARHQSAVTSPRRASSGT
jgi:AraC family transcriptional regulator, transcriptional activator of pobA